ncbi:hypothetical protein H0H93_015709 [Arthromyces matolae]|nr:hypothetical protein H0H93_015709 [Arthromyces matolae]
MCGRFALRLARDEIRHVPGYDGVDADDWIDEDQFVPRYNIAPRTQAPVLRRGENGGYVLHTMKWGLVPHWSKYEDKTLSTTNARAENLVDGGGMWASIKGKKRCGVIAQGYYEWLTKGKEKLPHFTRHRNGAVMIMAALYDTVILEGQTTPLWTFSIVTTDSNKDFSWLHDRQPVILSTRAALDEWLDIDSSQHWTPGLTKLVKPYSDETHPLECYQVPKEVGKVGTESPAFIEPLASRKDGIQAMFAKQIAKSQKSLSKRPRSPCDSDIIDLTDTASPLDRGKRPKIDNADDNNTTASKAPLTLTKTKSDPRTSKVSLLPFGALLAFTRNPVSNEKESGAKEGEPWKGKYYNATSNMKLDSFLRRS